MGLKIDWIRRAVQVFTPVYHTGYKDVPGIGTGVAYTAGDAFGTSFVLEVPKEGTITQIVFIDRDDENLQKDLLLFSAPFTETADNAAMAPSDADMANCVGWVTVGNFLNMANNGVGIGKPALDYKAPEGKLYCQFVTQGADNIAVGAIPSFFLIIQ